jgi:hypothetical protein
MNRDVNARQGWASLPLTAALGLLLSGCISMYVPNGLPDVAPSDYVKSRQPAPVQLLIDWTTQGKSNGKALGQTRDDIVSVVNDSGLFASTSRDPVPSGALLAITIDDSPVTDPNSAFAKGFRQDAEGRPHLGLVVRRCGRNSASVQRISGRLCEPTRPALQGS